jgi:hypothetical protein
VREGEVIRAEETRLQLACNGSSCPLEVERRCRRDIENRSGTVWWTNEIALLSFLTTEIYLR